MIGISTPTFDTQGSRVFRNADRGTEMKNRSGARRIARTATLDGGCVIADMGFSDGDRSLTAEDPLPGIEAVEFARYIVENYGLVVVTTEDGVYEAAPEAYDVNASGVLSIKLLVSGKLSG
jgi:hypothetical protein